MSRSRTAGITLIEVLVVLVIVGVATSVLSFGFGALGRTQLRSACNRLMSASRFAYSRAIIQGTTVRLSFNIPAEAFSIEEGHSQVTLSRADDARRDGERGRQEAGIDPWAAAQARIKDTFHPSLGASPFGPISNPDGSSSKRYSNIKFKDGVRIVRLYVPHEPGPVEEGTTGLYFFPGGRTQHAVIHVADRFNNVFSVEIHPLTGRAKVHPEAFVPDYLLGEPGQREHGEILDR